MNAFDPDAFIANSPTDTRPAVRGVWHALHGDWDAAHDAVNTGGTGCDWVHAALHREEGDLANADYWYRRAGRRRPGGSHRDEYLAIAAALLAD
ncbi:MAG: hypothetical protein KDE27_30740 [Planctomycetes bacterium]|nr:hypothetical protein [Planctomycetota bacterium]